MIQIIERIPEDRRSEALQTLLEKAREKVDEIAFLICEIDEADRLEDGQTALRKAEELLKIKPGHQPGARNPGEILRLRQRGRRPNRARCRNSPSRGTKGAGFPGACWPSAWPSSPSCTA